MAFTFPYLTLSIWRCRKFLVIEAKSLQEDRRVLDRSNSDTSELMLRRNQDKQLLHVELMTIRPTHLCLHLSPGAKLAHRASMRPTLGAKSLEIQCQINLSIQNEDYTAA